MWERRTESEVKSEYYCVYAVWSGGGYNIQHTAVYPWAVRGVRDSGIWFVRAREAAV